MLTSFGGYSGRSGRLNCRCGRLATPGFNLREKHYVTEKKPRFAIRFSRRNLRQDGGFVNIPLCLAERYQACLGERR